MRAYAFIARKRPSSADEVRGPQSSAKDGAECHGGGGNCSSRDEFRGIKRIYDGERLCSVLLNAAFNSTFMVLYADFIFFSLVCGFFFSLSLSCNTTKYIRISMSLSLKGKHFILSCLLYKTRMRRRGINIK